MRPRPSKSPPNRTTTRAPYRSYNQPHRNPPTPIQRKARVEAVEIPVRDQPRDSAIGCKKTPNDITPPMPMQPTTIPTATITQP